MKKAIHLLCILNFCTTLYIYAQEKAVYDGLEVTGAATNSNTYYYGELINVFFEFTNTSNQVKKYYKPLTGVNLIFFLKNKTTGKTIEPHLGFWSAGGHTRTRMRQNEPPAKLAYQPNEYGQYIVQVNEQFGTEPLTTQQISQNHDLANRLTALPVGEYELELKYYPLPANQEMIATFSFKVVDLPIEEKEAFKKYVQATVYASNAHFWAGKNYSASHKDSYENLIKAFPNSLFAQYAFLDMVREIYNYPGPNEASKVAKYKEYIKFYPRIKKSSLKMDYLRFLPEYVSKTPGINTQNHLDKVLYTLKDENPTYSRALIRTAEVQNNIKGLKNYSGKKP